MLIVALAVALSSSRLLAQSGKVEVHWLGQVAFKITTSTGKVIVLDPFLTQNPKTPREEASKPCMTLRLLRGFSSALDGPTR